MSDRPQFLNRDPLPYDCPFRDKCLKLLDRRANSTNSPGLWIVMLEGFTITFNDSDALVVYYQGSLIWSDGVAPWFVEDHEAEEYEDMLDRLLILDRLADV